MRPNWRVYCAALTAPPGGDDVLSSQRPPQLWARIDQAGLLTVAGLPSHPEGLTADHDEPGNAYAELINLALDLAETVGGEVWLHAETPTEVWAMAIHPGGLTIPIPTETLDPPPSARAADDPAQIADLERALAAVGRLEPPPADVVLALAADPAPGIRAAATAELSRWGDDPDIVVDADLTAEQLAALADCRLGWVRAGVAAHPGTDPITLDRLAKDADPLVVQTLAGRVDLPADLAIALVGHSQPVVRAELGRNPAAAFLLNPPTPARPTATPSGTATATAGGVAVATVPAPSGTRQGPPARGDPSPEHGPNPRIATPATGSAAPGTTRRRGRRLAGGLAAVVLLLGGSAAVWRSPDTTSPPSAATTSMVAWQGTWLPTGPDGPTDPTAPTVAGFAHTELGAAMAAAHLAVRIDPYAGPSSFRPTITRQTYGGDPAVLLDRTEAAYRADAAAAGITDGAAIPTSPGQIVGWRTERWASEGPVTVHLLVSGPTGEQWDYAIAVTWVDGDYRLVDPTRAGTFTTSEGPDPSTYTLFVNGGPR